MDYKNYSRKRVAKSANLQYLIPAHGSCSHRTRIESRQSYCTFAGGPRFVEKSRRAWHIRAVARVSDHSGALPGRVTGLFQLRRRLSICRHTTATAQSNAGHRVPPRSRSQCGHQCSTGDRCRHSRIRGCHA